MASDPIGTSADLEVGAVRDRRQSGRRDDVSSDLIPLLRGNAPPVPPVSYDNEEPGHLSISRGVALVLYFSATVWIRVVGLFATAFRLR